MIACEDDRENIIDILLKNEATVALKNKVNFHTNWFKAYGGTFLLSIAVWANSSSHSMQERKA